MVIIAVIMLSFGLCFLADKGFTKFFRNRTEHRSVMSLHLHKRFATIGIVLLVIGVAGLMASIEGGVAMAIGSLILLLVGVGLVIYYLSFGVYYDEDSFLISSFGKKNLSYRYEQIRHQKLYTLQGGGIIVELHMADGSAVQITGTMLGYAAFLDYAFSRWCQQQGIEAEDCPFHDPQQSIWFPNLEV